MCVACPGSNLLKMPLQFYRAVVQYAQIVRLIRVGEMELMLFIRVLLRRWWLVIVPVVVAAFFALPQLFNPVSGSGGFTARIKYTAAQELNIDREGGYQDLWVAAEYVAFSFTEWVRSDSFRREILDTVESPDTINLAALAVVADTNRSVNTLDLYYPVGEDLQRLADAAVEVLKTRNHIYFPNLRGEPAEVAILDSPDVVPLPPPIVNRTTPLIQIALALLAGIGLAVLADYLDPTLRHRDDLESAGIVVLAGIPPHTNR